MNGIITLIGLVVLAPISLTAQDSLNIAPIKFRLGFGVDVSSPSSGLHLFLHNNRVNLNLTYGLPTKSNKSSDVINEQDRSFTANVSFSFATIYLRKVRKSNGFVFPLVFGLGYTYVNEKSEVKGFTGNGVIKGIHYYVGMHILRSEVLSNKLGGHFYLGYGSWDYKNSILKQSGSIINYNYPKLYGSLGLYFYLF